jgi:hypothetical protein
MKMSVSRAVIHLLGPVGILIRDPKWFWKKVDPKLFWKKVDLKCM